MGCVISDKFLMFYAVELKKKKKNTNNTIYPFLWDVQTRCQEWIS